MFSNIEIQNEAMGVQIKQVQHLDKTIRSTNETEINKLYSRLPCFGTTGFNQQDNPTDVNNISLYDKMHDLTPRRRHKSGDTGSTNTSKLKTIKRPRSLDNDVCVNPSKRTKLKDLVIPNFRRPWPTTLKSAAHNSTTYEEKVTPAYTDYSISNIIKEDKASSQEIINDKTFQKQTCNYNMPEISYHEGNFNFKENMNKIKDKDIVNQFEDFISKYYESKPDYESRTTMATISEVHNDLNLTNDSEEDEYVNINCVKTEHDIDHEIKAQSNLNHSDLLWTIQTENSDNLKLVISKENNNTHSKNKSQMQVNDNCIDRDEQLLILPNKQKTIESKSNKKVSNFKTDKKNQIKMEPLIENTPNSKNKFQMQVNDNCLDRDEQPFILPNTQKTIESKSDSKLSDFKNDKKNKIEIEPLIENIPDNLRNSLKVSIPFCDTKKKNSKSLKRHSLPNTGGIKTNINNSVKNKVNKKKIRHSLPNTVKEEKIAQPFPKVFMKKLSWDNIKEKEKLTTDAFVKVHKMILHQDDGTITEVAVKAHLENLDWSGLGLVPQTMVIEESFILSNLQGIKGVPFLCGLILDNPPALVMSYYKGRTIGDYLEEGDTLLALRTFIRACEIVAKMNHRGWAHYDIHADNILGRFTYTNHISATLINFGFCRATNVNPHYGIYTDPEDMEGHHLPVDIMNKKCNGSYVDRFSLCYILEEISSKMRETSETDEIKDASRLGIMTEHPYHRPSPTHLAQLVTKLVGKHTHDTWKFNIDD